MKPGRHQSRKQRCPKGAVVYVESSLTVHNPLFFVHKLWLNKLMWCFYWSVSLKWWECYWTLCTAKTRVLKARTRKELRDRSLFIAWGGGGGRRGFWGGITWFLGEQKGGFSCNWEPKRGDPWKLWRDSDKNSNAENNAQNPLTAKA